MRCENCGAAMKLVRDRDYFVCEFCSAFHFPEEQSRDRVRVLKEPHVAECPICEVALREAAAEGQRVLYCESCRGLLVHRPAFNAILRSRRYLATDSAAKRPIEPKELEREIDCPRCRRRMETHPYLGPGAVVIDSCGRCALLWLDHGELHEIVTANHQTRARRTYFR